MQIVCGRTPLLNSCYLPLFTRTLDNLKDISIWCVNPTHTTYRPPTGSNTLKAETLRPDEDAALPASQKSTTLHPEFIRRYVYFARHQMEATLSENACQNIASAYADLRAKADERTLPVSGTERRSNYSFRRLLQDALSL